MRRGGLKKLAVVAVCGAAMAVSAFGVSTLWPEDVAVSTAATTGITQTILGAQDVKTFLAGYGLEIDPTAAEVTTVKIPRKWDDSFVAFHDVIKQSGLDLSKCKNKQVDKWTVLIPSKSDDQQKTYAVVLTYKNEPKGAYLLQKPSGEVTALTPSVATAAPLTEEELAANATFGTEVDQQEVYIDAELEEGVWEVSNEEELLDNVWETVADVVPEAGEYPTD
jgi:hypothetical protein